MGLWKKGKTFLSRRDFLKAGAAGAAGLAVAGKLIGTGDAQDADQSANAGSTSGHDGMEFFQTDSTGIIPEVTTDGFNPTKFLTDFDYGHIHPAGAGWIHHLASGGAAG